MLCLRRHLFPCLIGLQVLGTTSTVTELSPLRSEVEGWVWRVASAEHSPLLFESKQKHHFPSPYSGLAGWGAQIGKSSRGFIQGAGQL